MRALGTAVGWHAAAAGAFVVRVLTWPDRVDTGGDVRFTMSRWFAAFLLGVLLVVPVLCASFALSCGALALLGRWRHRSGVVVGTVATLLGMGTVAAALAVYAFVQR